MFNFLKTPPKGTERINEIVKSFKEQVKELNLGLVEIQQEKKKNNAKVDLAEQNLKRLKNKVHGKNLVLQTSETTAVNLRDNISKLLGE